MGQCVSNQTLVTEEDKLSHGKKVTVADRVSKWPSLPGPARTFNPASPISVTITSGGALGINIADPRKQESPDGSTGKLKHQDSQQHPPQSQQQPPESRKAGSAWPVKVKALTAAAALAVRPPRVDSHARAALLGAAAARAAAAVPPDGRSSCSAPVCGLEDGDDVAATGVSGRHSPVAPAELREISRFELPPSPSGSDMDPGDRPPWMARRGAAWMGEPGPGPGPAPPPAAWGQTGPAPAPQPQSYPLPPQSTMVAQGKPQPPPPDELPPDLQELHELLQPQGLTGYEVPGYQLGPPLPPQQQHHQLQQLQQPQEQQQQRLMDGEEECLVEQCDLGRKSSRFGRPGQELVVAGEPVVYDDMLPNASQIAAAVAAAITAAAVAAAAATTRGTQPADAACQALISTDADARPAGTAGMGSGAAADAATPQAGPVPTPATLLTRSDGGAGGAPRPGSAGAAACASLPATGGGRWAARLAPGLIPSSAPGGVLPPQQQRAQQQQAQQQQAQQQQAQQQQAQQQQGPKQQDQEQSAPGCLDSAPRRPGPGDPVRHSCNGALPVSERRSQDAGRGVPEDGGLKAAAAASPAVAAAAAGRSPPHRSSPRNSGRAAKDLLRRATVSRATAAAEATAAANCGPAVPSGGSRASTPPSRRPTSQADGEAADGQEYDPVLEVAISQPSDEYEPSLAALLAVPSMGERQLLAEVKAGDVGVDGADADPRDDPKPGQRANPRRARTTVGKDAGCGGGDFGDGGGDGPNGGPGVVWTRSRAGKTLEMLRMKAAAQRAAAGEGPGGSQRLEYMPQPSFKKAPAADAAAGAGAGPESPPTTALAATDSESEFLTAVAPPPPPPARVQRYTPQYPPPAVAHAVNSPLASPVKGVGSDPLRKAVSERVMVPQRVNAAMRPAATVGAGGAVLPYTVAGPSETRHPGPHAAVPGSPNQLWLYPQGEQQQLQQQQQPAPGVPETLGEPQFVQPHYGAQSLNLLQVPSSPYYMQPPAAPYIQPQHQDLYMPQPGSPYMQQSIPPGSPYMQQSIPPGSPYMQQSIPPGSPYRQLPPQPSSQYMQQLQQQQPQPALARSSTLLREATAREATARQMQQHQLSIGREARSYFQQTSQQLRNQGRPWSPSASGTGLRAAPAPASNDSMLRRSTFSGQAPGDPPQPERSLWLYPSRAATSKTQMLVSQQPSAKDRVMIRIGGVTAEPELLTPPTPPPAGSTAAAAAAVPTQPPQLQRTESRLTGSGGVPQAGPSGAAAAAAGLPPQLAKMESRRMFGHPGPAGASTAAVSVPPPVRQHQSDQMTAAELKRQLMAQQQQMESAPPGLVAERSWPVAGIGSGGGGQAPYGFRVLAGGVGDARETGLPSYTPASYVQPPSTCSPQAPLVRARSHRHSDPYWPTSDTPQAAEAAAAAPPPPAQQPSRLSMPVSLPGLLTTEEDDQLPVQGPTIAAGENTYVVQESSSYMIRPVGSDQQLVQITAQPVAAPFSPAAGPAVVAVGAPIAQPYELYQLVTQR